VNAVNDTAKVQLVLDNASVTCDGSAALYVKSADKVFLTMAEGSENTSPPPGTFHADGDTNVDGAVFAKSDLTLNGSGTLTVTSESGHGIVSKDDLKITSGTYVITAAKPGPERQGQRPHRGRHLHHHRRQGRHPLRKQRGRLQGLRLHRRRHLHDHAQGDGISASGT
jgi:hypothetical protein